jgi:hypothetical protein
LPVVAGAPANATVDKGVPEPGIGLMRRSLVAEVIPGAHVQDKVHKVGGDLAQNTLGPGGTEQEGFHAQLELPREPRGDGSLRVP